MLCTVCDINKNYELQKKINLHLTPLHAADIIFILSLSLIPRSLSVITEHILVNRKLYHCWVRNRIVTDRAIAVARK